MNNVMFTRQRGGRTYLASEVDLYIETLQNAYQELSQEIEDRNTSGDDVDEAELERRVAEQTSRLRESLQAANNRLRESELLIDKLEAANTNSTDEMTDAEYRLRQEEFIAEQDAFRDRQEQLMKEQEQFLRNKDALQREREDLQRQCESISQRQEILLTGERELAEKTEEYERRQNETEADRSHTYLFGENVEESIIASHGAMKYIDIFEEARRAADRYVADIEERMDSMASEMNNDIEERQNESRRRALGIIRKAHEEAESILQEAHNKSEWLDRQAEERLRECAGRCEDRKQRCDTDIRRSLDKAKKEYADIRERIRQAGGVYAEIAAVNGASMTGSEKAICKRSCIESNEGHTERIVEDTGSDEANANSENIDDTIAIEP